MTLRRVLGEFHPARLAFLIALGTTLAHAAVVPNGTPRLEVPLPEIMASDRLTWTVPIRFINETELGLYVDSLMCDVENLDRGEIHGPRKTRLSLNLFTRLVSSISAGDTGAIQCFVPASAESARLTLHAYGHNSKGKTFAFEATTSAVPSMLSRSHPSEFLTVGGRTVEVAFVGARPDTGKAPGILMIHGEGSQARAMLNIANRLAQEGTAVMLVSQPGYGQSQGPPDWAGPATVEALAAALDRLEKSPGVDPKRIGVWGISRGATAATLLAAKRPEVRAVVAQSGSYDLWATHRGGKLADVRESIEKEAGRDSAAWKARSPLLQAKAIRAQVMVMHGEKDDQMPIEQARAFAAALDLRGHPTETNFSETGHSMPPSAQLPAQHFFERALKP